MKLNWREWRSWKTCRQNRSSWKQNDTATQFSRVMMDAISGLYDCVSSIELPAEFVFAALVRLYNSRDDHHMLKRWENFQRHWVLDFRYCLYGVLYWGHGYHDLFDPGVAVGVCYCRPDLNRLNNVPINRSTRCIRIKRDGKKGGKLCFSWGNVLGRCPDLTRWE
ncbi:hypothetical protein QR685DRAFT_523082 [Neurospora intermedia]|uniref:Uncharacterized protein n=1 Tax=Neurospora intermedia TaxID=5142 RepID=A0ABR3DC12_NEUIN